jgi:hypothetical protein
MGSKQLGFGDYEQATAKKRTRRERFLGEMEKVVPWKPLFDLIGLRPVAQCCCILMAITQLKACCGSC